ncbi:MAG: helix-turn-helix domain-containing protein [Acidobacteria bacterium]|nr:helix-turn-helix domain-containing protein [Acidobacteriota bacterium]MBI3654880.1 helix-turn-helix domain-containing protein [Acidobacteriota bacterium]
MVVVKIKKPRTKMTEAAELLGLSYRQTQRIYERYAEECDAGLAHRSRGQTSNHTWGAKEKQKSLERYIATHK